MRGLTQILKRSVPQYIHFKVIALRTFENFLPLPTSGPWPFLGVAAAAVRVEPRVRAGVVGGRTGRPGDYHEHDGGGAQKSLTQTHKSDCPSIFTV
jgi:hypothetical protein